VVRADTGVTGTGVVLKRLMSLDCGCVGVCGCVCGCALVCGCGFGCADLAGCTAMTAALGVEGVLVDVGFDWLDDEVEETGVGLVAMAVGGVGLGVTGVRGVL
jgi:hypothetical protein